MANAEPNASSRSDVIPAGTAAKGARLFTLARTTAGPAIRTRATLAPFTDQPVPLCQDHAPAFVILSFEGPDAYSSAGGLGVRVSGLAAALAEHGYETHLFFVGSPESPGHEASGNGQLHLHRWCQWISRHHDSGVYDGEEGKLYDWNRSLPAWLEKYLLPMLINEHRSVFVIGEEWHTSWSVIELGRRVRECGWCEHVHFFWNANNTFGFERVPWTELREAATITTVSRFMKHDMWRFGVNARVIPNGIASQWLEPCERAAVSALKRVTAGRLLLSKVARWDPDKRWLMAVDAVHGLKAQGLRPLLVARGGVEAHGGEVMAHACAIGLETTVVACADDTAVGLCRTLETARSSDVVFVRSPLSRDQLRCLYRASDGVLANSGIEPFGLVGLEAMACGGLSFLGATGEDYARPGHDSISLQTASPRELVAALLRLREHPDVTKRLRHEARRTASNYTWDQVIRTHIAPMFASPELALA